MSDAVKNEFSKPFYIREAVSHKTTREITLTEKDKKVLMERFDLSGLDNFAANFTIKKSEDDSFYDVQFRIKGKATIISSFDDQPVEIEVDEEDHEYYTTDKDMVSDDDMNFNSPELIGKDGMIDLGELASDYFYLMIDEKYRAIIFEKMNEGFVEEAEELTIEDITVEKKDTHRPFADLKKIMEEKK